MLQNSKLIFILLFIVYTINPFNQGYLAGYLLFALLLFRFNRTLELIDFNSILLLFFSFTYSMFYSFKPDLGTQFILIYAIIPLTLYLAGKQVYCNDCKKNFNIIILILIGFSFCSSSMASVLIAINEDGFVTIKRDVPLIWTGEKIPATNMASAFVMNMCIPGILIIGFNNIRPHLVKILSITAFILSLTCVLRLGSRTHLAISFFSIVIALVYRFRKQNFIQNLGLTLLLLVLVNLAFAYLSFDSNSDIFTAYADRMDSKKYGAATAGGRTEKWATALEYMFSHPLGWKLDEFGFVHNLWLDVLRVGGLICFILLLSFTYKSIINLIALLRRNNGLKLIDGQLLIYSICILLVFFVEPIMEGYFTLFSLFCFLTGFTSEHIKNLRIKRVYLYKYSE